MPSALMEPANTDTKRHEAAAEAEHQRRAPEAGPPGSPPGPSAATLVGGILNDVQGLFTQQLELFKAELKRDLVTAREGAELMAVGAGLASVGLVVLAFALAHLLAWAVPGVPLWGWYAAVGGFMTAAGVPLVGVVLARLKASRPMSETTAGLEETMEWKTDPK
jgi:uncharacterized sodium:solute symporter family permease YidK